MQSSDIKFYKAKANGRVSRAAADEVIPGGRENVFRRITTDERTNGVTRVEKIFACNCNLSNEPMYGFKLWLDKPSAGDDYEWFAPGTQRNTALGGSERKYAVGALKTDIGSGVSTGVFTLEHASLSAMFADADNVTLSKKPDGATTTGTEELKTISAPPSLSGVDLTVTFTPATVATFSVAEGSRLSSVYSYGDLLPELGTVNGTTTGTIALDDSQITLDYNGTMEQVLTVYFPGTDGTFTVTSDDPDIGNLPSGSTASDYAPLNPANSKPYISIPAVAWSGTPAAADQFAIPTTPPAAPLFVTCRVEPGSQQGYSVPQICWSGDA